MSICQLMHKLFNMTIPEPLQGMILQTQDVHDRHTRQQRYFRPCKYTNSIVEISFLCKEPKLWDSLSDNLKALTYTCFSKKLKQSFINRY